MRVFEMRQRAAKLPAGEQDEPTQPHTVRRLRIEREDSIDTLLRTATAPKRVTKSQARERALKIVAAIKANRGRVSRDQLREIVTKQGMPFSSVGALFQGGYVKRQGKSYVFGQRGQRARAAVERRNKASVARRKR